MPALSTHPPLFGEDDGFDGSGRDADGYHRDGFNANGRDRGGYGRDGYNEEGYDVDGYNEEGYDADGFNASGYNEEGYDADGFNASGYNKEGYDADGNPKNVSADDLDLRDLWATHQTAQWLTRATRQAEFLTYLRGITREPETIDNVVFCADCGNPAWDDETCAARGDRDVRVCESCVSSSWSNCDRCEDQYRDSELQETLGGAEICPNCRDNYYSYCETCNGYHPSDDASEHDHDTYSGCCTSPQQNFTIRNDGYEPLANDTRVTVSLPSGTISPEGLTEIGKYLQSWALYDPALGYHSYPLRSFSRDLKSLGNQWQTTTGNFAKRLSAHAYRAYKIKLDPEILSRVGTIAREHSQPVDIIIEVTRDLNQSAEYFYHEDSCWWGNYGESRCALKTNGGFGLRAFNSSGNVSGRAWVLPLRSIGHGTLCPTFDTVTPDAFVLFNEYGELGGYTASRVMAHMAGWTYRKIGFRCEPMYVNAGGFLVAPEGIARQYADKSLTMSVPQHASLFADEQSN